MVRVEEADNIIRAHTGDYGIETVLLEQATGRILAEPIRADRDMPPFNRATMDGIAISHAAYRAGIRSFEVRGVQAAGDPPINITAPTECIEIMTGSSLPETVDTVIAYEDLLIEQKQAIVQSTVQSGQNIHTRGKDHQQGAQLVAANKWIDAPVVGVAASTGKDRVAVKKLPRTVIVSTGNELVEVAAIPNPYQIRRSNNYVIRAVLQRYGLAADMLHIPDDREMVERQLAGCLEGYDVILLSGGVSMGKFDFVPQALKKLQVEELFYKVQQRPGKPLWFGRHQQKGTRVFGFPGNPVSTFLCLHRYLLPWLNTSLGLPPAPPLYAMLEEDICFAPPLQYFIPVSWQLNAQAQSVAVPQEGNGSGDFANLLDAHAFMELPATRQHFSKGEVFPIWPFTPLL